jgi:hypothetical protein
MVFRVLILANATLVPHKVNTTTFFYPFQRLFHNHPATGSNLFCPITLSSASHGRCLIRTVRSFRFLQLLIYRHDSLVIVYLPFRSNSDRRTFFRGTPTLSGSKCVMASLLSSTHTTYANRVKDNTDHLDFASFWWISHQFRCDLKICCNGVNDINTPWPRQRIKMTTWTLLNEDRGRGNKISFQPPAT